MQQSSTQKKILIVIGVLWIGGGAEKVAAWLGTQLTRRGYEVHLLTFYEGADMYPYEGIYHSLNELSKRSRIQKIIGIPRRVRAIARYAKQHDIETAISFLEEANFYTLLSKLIFHRKLPVIVSVRNNILKRSWLFRVATKVLYPYAKSVVSVTRAVEEILKDKIGLVNTTTIYNPIDIAKVVEKMTVSLPAEFAWLHDRSPLCISIGRLIDQKGQWHMIRAFSKVVEQCPAATLVILGEGYYKEELQQLIVDCNLTDNVYLLGKHKNIYSFLSAADIFVFSSLYEGMPNTMLEGLSAGLPIISPDCISGPREIIAPEISVTQKIEYPYTSPYGVLVAPQEEAPLWETASVVPLSEPEAQLAAAIGRAIKTDWKRSDSYSVYKDRVADFSVEQTLQAWEELL